MEEKQGFVHLYRGDGKGKTTAAMGLALRALGAGRSVTVFQFLKDGTSSELAPLKTLGARVYAGQRGTKFVFAMTPEEKARLREEQTRRLLEALKEPCDLLVLDEAGDAWELDTVDPTLLKRAVLERPQGREVVLTAHSPVEWMEGAADYVTEMRCCCHPYQRGIAARKGIEY